MLKNWICYGTLKQPQKRIEKFTMIKTIDTQKELTKKDMASIIWIDIEWRKLEKVNHFRRKMKKKFIRDTFAASRRNEKSKQREEQDSCEQRTHPTKSMQGPDKR